MRIKVTNVSTRGHNTDLTFQTVVKSSHTCSDYQWWPSWNSVSHKN